MNMLHVSMCTAVYSHLTASVRVGNALRDSIGPTNIEKGLLWFEGVRYGDIQIHVKKFCMVWCSAVYPELPQLTHSLMQYLAHSIMWIYFLGVRNWQVRETSSSFALCNICSSQRHRNWFSSSYRHAMSLAPLQPGHFPPRSLSPLWWWVKGWRLKGNKHELIASQPT